jgi:glycosyltransferase involved in cell wall biosynthesis
MVEITKPLVSLCMMVKNEESILERCLQSIHFVADEIIIVDTGSTDRTVEIASKYTDKIFYHGFDGDFAKVRNFVVSKASGEYICRWDADWILRTTDKKKLSVLKDQKFQGVDEVHFNWLNEYNPTTLEPISMSHHLFLHKREKYIYDGLMHYSIELKSEFSKTIPTKLLVENIWVYHEKNPVIKTQRYSQTHEILQKQIAKLKIDHKHWIMLTGFYIDSCIYLGHIEEAVVNLEKLISILPTNHQKYLLYVEQYIILLIQIDSIMALKKASYFYKRFSDPIITLLYADVLSLSDISKSCVFYEKYLGEIVDKNIVNLNYERYIVHPLIMLGTLQKDKKLLEKAKGLTRKITNQSKIETTLQNMLTS